MTFRFKKDDDRLSGKLNYSAVTNEDVIIVIGNVFSLKQDYVYFSWSIADIGFGQFSIGHEDGVWDIMNECMSPERCYMLIEAFEKAVRATEDERAIYCIDKMISQVSYNGKSLAQTMLLIWNNPTTIKEGGESRNLKDMIGLHIDQFNDDYYEEKEKIVYKKTDVVGDTTIFYSSVYKSKNEKKCLKYTTLEIFYQLCS